MVTLPLAATSGCIPEQVAIGANAGLPATWNYILKQSKVFCDHARQEPVPFLGHPLCTAGQEQGPSVLVRSPDFHGDQGSSARSDWGAFDQQLDSGVAKGAIVAEAVTHADQFVSESLGEAFCAILVRGIRLGNAKCRETGIGCFHAAESTGGDCEA